MDIGKEHGRVFFDLAYVEALATVRAARVDTGDERTGDAADASSGALAGACGVGKGDAMTRILMLVTDGSLEAVRANDGHHAT